MIEDVALMLEAEEADRDEILDAIDRARRARALFRGGDTPAAMSALAGAFHALRHSAPRVEPWAPDALWAWLDEGTASTYELASAHFVLAVFDPRGPAGPLDAIAALAGWDRANRAAFVEWARALVAVTPAGASSWPAREQDGRQPDAPGGHPNGGVAWFNGPRVPVEPVALHDTRGRGRRSRPRTRRGRLRADG